MSPLDIQIFQALNLLAGYDQTSDWLIAFLARYLPYGIAVISVLVLFLAQRKKVKEGFLKRIAHIYIASFAARFVFTPLVRYVIPVERPFAALPDVIQLIPHEASASFPSGHAAFFFALAASIWFYDRSLGIWFFAAAAVVGIARIAAGVHWPSDVLAGAILGVGTAVGAEVIYKRYSARQN